MNISQAVYDKSQNHLARGKPRAAARAEMHVSDAEFARVRRKQNKAYDATLGAAIYELAAGGLQNSLLDAAERAGTPAQRDAILALTPLSTRFRAKGASHHGRAPVLDLASQRALTARVADIGGFRGMDSASYRQVAELSMRECRPRRSGYESVQGRCVRRCPSGQTRGRNGRCSRSGGSSAADRDRLRRLLGGGREPNSRETSEIQQILRRLGGSGGAALCSALGLAVAAPLCSMGGSALVDLIADIPWGDILSGVQQFLSGAVDWLSDRANDVVNWFRNL